MNAVAWVGRTRDGPGLVRVDNHSMLAFAQLWSAAMPATPAAAPPRPSPSPSSFGIRTRHAFTHQNQFTAAESRKAEASLTHSDARPALDAPPPLPGTLSSVSSSQAELGPHTELLHLDSNPTSSCRSQADTVLHHIQVLDAPRGALVGRQQLGAQRDAALFDQPCGLWSRSWFPVLLGQ